MKRSSLAEQTVFELLNVYPYLKDFFSALSIPLPQEKCSLKTFIFSQKKAHLEKYGLDPNALLCQAVEFVSHMSLLENQKMQKLQQVTVKAGFDKSGEKEQMDVSLSVGEVVCIVGPTGSGKSLLLTTMN